MDKTWSARLTVSYHAQLCPSEVVKVMISLRAGFQQKLEESDGAMFFYDELYLKVCLPNAGCLEQDVERAPNFPV